MQDVRSAYPRVRDDAIAPTLHRQTFISPFFPNPWPPRLSDLNASDFWLWGYLKCIVYRGIAATLND